MSHFINQQPCNGSNQVINVCVYNYHMVKSYRRAVWSKLHVFVPPLLNCSPPHAHLVVKSLVISSHSTKKWWSDKILVSVVHLLPVRLPVLIFLYDKWWECLTFLWSSQLEVTKKIFLHFLSVSSSPQNHFRVIPTSQCRQWSIENRKWRHLKTKRTLLKYLFLTSPQIYSSPTPWT